MTMGIEKTTGILTHMLVTACMLYFGATQAAVAVATRTTQPIYFEVNKGQAPADILFLSRGDDYALYLTTASAQLSLASRGTESGSTAVRRTQLRIAPVGIDGAAVNTKAPLRGVEALSGKSHYFIGNQQEHWLTGIEHFRKVVYPRVYPGIDMLFHGDSGQLEFDFLLAPGAQPEQIRLKITGAERLKLDPAGNLRLESGGREVVLQAPRSFQNIDGARQEIATRFKVVDEQTVGFKVSAYDSHRSLVIDPILVFSSYAGGSANDIAHGVAYDTQGNIYVVGETNSTDFPVKNAYQATSPANASAFVMKLDATTHDVVYATYIGNNVVEARGIAVDSAGSAYIVGDTGSTTFPLMNAYQATMRGLVDIFVTKLTPAGDALSYSTYFGGDSVDRGRAIAIDSLGDVYIAGVTASSDFPLANPRQTALLGGTDAYVAKLSPVRGTLDYSTYIGGGGLDYATAVVVDAAGQAYVGGYTSSGSFPTLNPLQASKAGLNDAFALRLSAQGDLSYSTYLGGAGEDYANAIGVDAAGNIHLAGQTTSLNFPVSNPLQGASAGSMDAFVTKLNATGAALLYSTYLGGAQGDVVYGLRLDAAGDVYLAGQTGSTDFPVVNAVQANNAGGGSDAFVAHLTSSGASLVYSTYLGGAASDYARALAVDADGNVAVVGVTESDDLPRVDVNQSLRGGAQDAFIAELLVDSDDDGIADKADNCPEVANSTQENFDQDALGDACDADIDGDELANEAELGLGTDPANPDSDADTLTDGAEVNQYATDPTAPDSDSDGLNDAQEVLVYGTNPNHADTGDIAPLNAADGEINVADLLILMRYLQSLQSLDEKAMVLGDMNKDGIHDMRDALLLRRILNQQ